MELNLYVLVENVVNCWKFDIAGIKLEINDWNWKLKF